MKLLVINAGSSSIKYQLFNMDNEELLAKGLVQRIGDHGSKLEHKAHGQKFEIEKPMKDHNEGLKLILETLVDKKMGVIESIDEINGFGHRYVNAGEDLHDPVLVTDKLLETFKQTIEFAPLHNPANIMGIEACRKIAPSVPNVAVFDIGFYKNLPMKAKLYPIRYDLFEKYSIQRFGAHGISHDFVSHHVAELMERDYKDLKIITCHIGNGASISAIKNGVCVDTSMGFTPLEGIMMGTRSGDIDPAVVPYLMKKMNLSADEIISIFNKQSGLLGISGISNDIRDILAVMNTNERARLAIEMFVYKIKKYIGSYAAAMGGVDVIVFTAGSGENRADIREWVMEDFEFMGVDFDKEANANFTRGIDFKISKEDSKVAVYIVPTDEELMIARVTKKFVE